MPLEIKELYIKLTVNTTDRNAVAPPASSAATGGGGVQVTGNEAIIAECVEQVLYILQQKYER